MFCMLEATNKRNLQLQGHRVDISTIYVTKQGRRDPVLVHGDELAKRAFWLFGVEIRRMPFPF